MGDRFVAPTGAEIRAALGVSVFYVLSDMPWSFEVMSANGETVKVWVTEHPGRVDVDVGVYTLGELTFTVTREAASRLAVSEHAPQIVVESGSESDVGRLEIFLTPRLSVRDTLRRG